MDLRTYQMWTRTTAQHNEPPTPLGADLLYLGCGLAGEAGEVANQVKKIHRDDFGELRKERRTKIVDEAGDTMWYLARILDACDITFEEVLNRNRAKLSGRLADGTIKGDRRDVARVTLEQNPDLKPDVSLSPALQPRATTEPSADSFAGAPGEGGGERRSGVDYGFPDHISFTKEDFANGFIPGPEVENSWPLWFVRLRPEKGPLARTTIIRQFRTADEDGARAAAREKYGRNSIILRVDQSYNAAISLTPEELTF